MFSGIVETTGKISERKMINHCLNISITPHTMINDLEQGESIAINGVCLTITAYNDTTLSVTVVPETLALTTLAYLKLNDSVNLERSCKINGRLGGHYVQGHVDGISEIYAIFPAPEAHIDKKTSSETEASSLINTAAKNMRAWMMHTHIPKALAKYIVKKGYIAIDGMSLTVIDITDDQLTTTLIPYTYAHTIAQYYQPGTLLNIEVDIIAKYTEKLLKGQIA